MKLSIIVPVYQVEEYIRPCVESIFQQGIADADLEVLLIDDGTTDDSFGRIVDIIDEHENIIVVSQPNLGLSAARNTGLAKATGDYVLFLDSDDLLVPHSLLPVLHEANQKTPDMVIAGFVKLDNKEILNMGAQGLSQTKVPTATNPAFTATTGKAFFLGSFNPRECYVWRTLYRKAFLDANNLRFINGIYFEDVPFTTQCYLKAGRCLHTSQTIYIYRQRAGSICSTVNMSKILDMNKVLACLWEMYTGQTEKAVNAQLMNTLFVTFSNETWFITHNNQLLARSSEIVNDLRQRIPDLHFTGGLEEKIVSFLFRLMPKSYFRLRKTAKMLVFLKKSV
jgi:glycosyltransferase involved in cell wall biosynthesis